MLISQTSKILFILFKGRFKNTNEPLKRSLCLLEAVTVSSDDDDDDDDDDDILFLQNDLSSEGQVGPLNEVVH